MAVPYIFANTPGGSSLLLSELDANFAYVTTSPAYTGNVSIGGNLTVGGSTTFTGPVTATDMAINGVLTVDGVSVNPGGITGTGLLVLNTGPTFVAPILGTPASGDLTNCTGYQISQVAGLATGVLPFLTNPTTANLAAAVVDETGTGNLVLSNNPTLTAPTLVAPVLGTPASGNLSACTNFPAANLSGTVPVTKGGTGLAVTGAVGDVLAVTAPNTLGYVAAPAATSVAGGAASQVLYQSAPNTTSFIPNGIVGQPLVSNGAAPPSWGQVGLTSGVSGILPVSNGGTNSTTQQGAIDNLVGSTAAGTYLRGNGVNAVMSTLQVSDIPTLNQNTTGSAATFTSTTQNSQFNSIGIGTAAPGSTGNMSLTGTVTVGTGVKFTSLTTQTDAATGYGQTWQDVKASRVAGTTYTNATTKPIMVIVSLYGGGAAGSEVVVNGVNIWDGNSGLLGGGYSCTFLVPPSGTYVLNHTSGTPAISSWAELR